VTNLPQGWVEVHVGDVAESLIDGPFGSNLKTEHYTVDGVRVIRLQNIGDGRFDDTDKAFITEERYQLLSRHAAQPDDVLIAALGDVLPRACLVPPKLGAAIVKADCFRLRPNDLVDAKYLMFALESPQMRRAAAPQIAGVGRPRLNLRKVRNLPIAVAPLAEQKRIVAMIEDAFLRIDAGVAGLRRAQRDVVALQKAIILAAVTEPYPAHWQRTTVGQAGQVMLGRQRSPKYHHGPKMRRYLRVANVFEDRIDTDDIMSMHFEDAEYDRYRLAPDDILLNEGQSPHLLGRPAIYRGDPPNVAFTNSLLRFRAGPGVLPGWALLVFRRHLHAKRFLRESQITTNIAHLSAGRFKTVEFPIPPIDEQEAIVASVEAQLAAAARVAAELDGQLARAGRLRSSILSVAVAGKLVPQEPEDEPASVLLNLIAVERDSSNSPRDAAGGRQTRSAGERVTA